MVKNRWSDRDRQAFKDGDRLRASKVPGKLVPPPDMSEWDDVPSEGEEGIQYDTNP
jgi:hypothetical protein